MNKIRINELFNYYKYHTLLIAFSVFVFGSILYSFINHQIEQTNSANEPAPDLEILFFGEYHTEETSRFEEQIEQQVPNVDNVEVNVEYSPAETDSEMDISSAQMRPVALMKNEPDIYITDKTHFDLMTEMDAFYPIDSEEEFLQEVSNDSLQRNTADDEEIYGIDVSDSSVFHDSPFGGAEKIVSIRENPKNVDNAIEWIKRAVE
ncbi:hypothetical protein [Halobacillus sp. A5]|uniref:hypothetical protein n=1 Tax=Halobacillus sp. A5 TaxID=2880263 RepID=UPI0020A68F32|nr:hypothetical protein [Halobacillus sp. A5]